MTVAWAKGPVRVSPPMALADPPAPEPDMSFHANANVATEVQPQRFFDLLIPRLAGTA